MATILCITLNPAIDVTIELDKLVLGAVNRQERSQERPAGKGLNVAQVLKALGHEVIVTGFLGKQNAQLFIEDFTQRQFSHQFVMIEAKTRHNIKIAESSGRMTDINGQGFCVESQDIKALAQIIQQTAKTADMVVLSGSLPQGLTLADFAQLIDVIKSCGTPLAVDTSGQALVQAIKLRPFLIKPNSDELTEAYDLPADDVKQQQLLLNHHCQGIENIVISMGEHGVNWFGADLHASAPHVNVKSTVGAGDTLLAGVIHGLVSGLDTKETLTLATALASHAVTQIGLALPDTKTLTDLKQQVHISNF